MGCINMKKKYLLIILIIVFSFPSFSLDFSRKETVFVTKDYRIFPEFMYFNDLLLFNYNSLKDFSILNNQQLIPVYDFENEIQPKVKHQIYLGGDIYKKIDSKSLIDTAFAFYDESIFLAYEIIEKNNKILKQEITKDEFNSLLPNLQKFVLPKDIDLCGKYKLKLTYGSDDGKWPTYFQIMDLNGNIKYDFREMFPYVIIRGGMFAVNDKKNRIAFVVDSPRKIEDGYNKEYILVELCIIYDAVCNDTNVRVRTDSSLDSETLFSINKGEKVKIIDKSDNPFEIDGESHYWYKVESGTYPVGWVYGKYLDIEECVEEN